MPKKRRDTILINTRPSLELRSEAKHILNNRECPRHLTRTIEMIRGIFYLLRVHLFIAVACPPTEQMETLLKKEPEKKECH